MRSSSPTDTHNWVFAGEPLERHVALVVEGEAAALSEELLEVARDQDLVAGREVGDAEGVDDRLSEELVRVANGFAGVEADANADRLLGMVAAEGLERAMQCDRTAHPRERRWKRNEESVTSQLDLESTVRFAGECAWWRRLRG